MRSYPLIPGSDDIFVIADIGKNFIQTEEDRPMEEYLSNAKKMIDEAHAAGVDAVKFQTHEVEDEQLPVDIKSPHFKEKDRYSWVKRNTDATPLAFWKELKNYCDKKNVLFFSTPMSRKSAQKLQKLDVPLWKIASGDVQDHVLLDYLFSTKKPMMMSTGMVSLRELDEVVRYVHAGQDAALTLTILYCVSKYPCPPEFFNLSTITHLQKTYPKAIIGFSDHSLGHDVALAAVKVGARVIEKHFSMSRDVWGPDHKVSMTPAEMTAMVKAIRSGAYKDIDPSPYLGESSKELEGATNQFRPYFLKTLVAFKDLEAGTVLQKDMIAAMRPQMQSTGFPSQEFEAILGRRITRNMRQYDPFTKDLLA
jgi:sialic acid synthase SpsE